MTRHDLSRGFIVVSLFALASCGQQETSAPKQAEPASAAAEQRIEGNPDRNAYFGEEHIHTSWSVDAWLIGNRVTGPADALKYAQGETIKHPMGYDIKIDTPMDFMGVTDHSEYVGVTKQANTPGSAISKMPEAQPLIIKDLNDPAQVQKVFLYLLSLTSKPPIKAFMSPELAGTIWTENIKIADENNHPGKFTAFCSYESQDPYAVTVYKLGDTYYGARSNEFGYANYQIVPTPQYIVQPIEVLTDQFATELGLTEQQKQQIIPILKDEVPKLQALKNEASLSAMDKVRQLREIGEAVDAKVTPLLNPDQQQKFQAMRERLRRRIIEQAGVQLMEKLEVRAGDWL